MENVVSLKDVQATRKAAERHEHFLALSHDLSQGQQAFWQGMNLMVTSMLRVNAALLCYFLPR